MRENENMDLHHGPRAAEFIRSIAGSWIKLEEHRLHKLMQACRYHSVGRLDRDITIQTCWDADRLELGRVGIKPSPERLCTEFSKRKDGLSPKFFALMTLEPTPSADIFKNTPR